MTFAEQQSLHLLEGFWEKTGHLTSPWKVSLSQPSSASSAAKLLLPAQSKKVE